MSDAFDPTADEVRSLRDARGCGILEARRELRRDNLLWEVKVIRESAEHIETKLHRLLAVVEALISNE